MVEGKSRVGGGRLSFRGRFEPIHGRYVSPSMATQSPERQTTSPNTTRVIFGDGRGNVMRGRWLALGSVFALCFVLDLRS